MIIQNETNVVIAMTAEIHPSVCIGERGFGYDKIDDKFIQQIHKFGVIIEDYVDIKSNVSIHRGRWRDTVIGEGTKIDSGVLVAHNVVIGKNCLIGAHATLCGSCEIGDGAEIWVHAKIHQGVKVGKGAVVGAGTYLRKDVPNDHVAYMINGTLILKHKKETKKYGGGVLTT